MSTTRKITLAAMLATTSIFLTRVTSVVIPLGGYPSLSFDIGSVPLVVGGVLLGPFFGALIGLVSDLLGFMINSRGGVFHFGFTLNAILTGLIPGVLFIVLKGKRQKRITYGLLLVMLLTSYYYFLVVRASDLLMLKLTALITITLITGLMGYYVYRIKNNLLLNTLFIILVVEIFVYITLTPIWIYQLFNLPIFISIISRVFRALILVPIKTTITYQTLKILQN